MMNGVNFVVSDRAVKEVVHWPRAKRSRRLHKKMLKLRGPQFTTEPAAFAMADGRMVIHPEIYRKLKDAAE